MFGLKIRTLVELAWAEAALARLREITARWALDAIADEPTSIN